MHLQRFTHWCETAGSRQRADGFAILAAELVEPRMPDVDGRLIESAVLLALDDPSPLVRLAVAQVVGRHRAAPRALVKALLLDDAAIAAAVARSSVLSDDDLLDALALARPCLQAAMAERVPLSRRLAMAIAMRGTAEACARLLANDAADIDPATLRRISVRHGTQAGIRTSLLARQDLPPDVRQSIIIETGRCLQFSPFVEAVLGAEDARRVALDACERATSTMAGTIGARDMPGFVDHLRTSGQISAAFLVRAALAGNIDLLAASLTALSGLSERRVRAIVVEGREGPFRSLVQRCGLALDVARLLQVAVRHWKDLVTGGEGHDAEDVPDLVMRRVVHSFRQAGECGNEALAALLRRLESETLQDAMRWRVRRTLAA